MLKKGKDEKNKPPVRKLISGLHSQRNPFGWQHSTKVTEADNGFERRDAS